MFEQAEADAHSIRHGTTVLPNAQRVLVPDTQVVERSSDFPQLPALRKVRTCDEDPREVVVVDHEQDSSLFNVEERVSDAMAETYANDTVARIKVGCGQGARRRVHVRCCCLSSACWTCPSAPAATSRFCSGPPIPAYDVPFLPPRR